jgi:hypothetical protein
MKNRELPLLFAGLFLCGAVMPARAQERPGDERRLENSAGELDRGTDRPERRQQVTDRIKAEYGVNDARIQSLRDKKMGYGEISIALGLAQGLPGGITDENVQKIMVLRQGPPVAGWGKIAKDLGLKLGPVQSKVHKISAEARKQKKDDKVKKDVKAESEKRMERGKMEKPEKPERPEKTERMERPEKPEKGGRH